MAAQGQVPLFMIGQTVSHYRIVEKLGAGGMGEVYRAEDTRLGRSVALKVLAPQFGRDPQRRKRFQEEARAAAALTHPGIATVYELEEVGDDLYIVFEYVRGETLRAVVKRGPLATDELVDVAVDIARALAAAHEYGIVHRDLKPENIIRTPDGETKILDFGLARFQPAALESSTAPTRLTEAGTILGTVAYMSPEQLEGKDADYRTDIFSFGVLLYELATGTHPFEGSTPASTIARIMTAEPVPVVQRNPLSPPELDRIVRKCLRKRREERYQSTRDLLVDLEQLRRESGEARALAAVAAEVEEPGLVQRALRVWGLTPRRWWEMDTLAELLVFYPLMIYFFWKVPEWSGEGPGDRLGLFIYSLVWVVAPVSLRVFLLATAAFNPAALPREVRRLAPWLRFTHLLVLFWLLVMTSFGMRASHPGFTTLLVGFVVMGVVAVLIIDPAINRAAFPEIGPTEPAAPGLAECRRIGWIQAIYSVPFGLLMLFVPGSIAEVIGGKYRWDELVIVPPSIAEVIGRTGGGEEAALVGMVVLWAVVLAFGIVMGRSMVALWEGNRESVGVFYRRFPLFLLGDLLAVALIVWLLAVMRVLGVGLLVLPVLLYLPFYQRGLARKLLRR